MKRIISLLAAIAIMISFLNISVYADDNKMTWHELHTSTLDTYQRWIDGKITTSEMNSQINAINTKYCDDYGLTEAELYEGVGANLASVSKAIGYAIDKYADNAREYVSDFWNDVCNKNNVPIENTQTSTTDYRGYGAIVAQYSRSDNREYYYNYCDYVVKADDVYYMYTISRNGQLWRCCSYTSYNFKFYYEFNSGSQNYYFYDERYDFYFYGDIRYKDGTPAPTDDDFTYGTIRKYDEMDDKEIDNLVKDLAEELQRQNPDLSSLEGLLKAIYARMGKLDSDDDNDLLSTINTSILSLKTSINDLKNTITSSSTDIVTSIDDFKETITSLLTNDDKKDYDNDNNKTEKHEISGTLYNVIPLEKSWLKKFSDEVFDNKANLKVEYEGKVYYLEDDGTLKLGDKYYKVDMNYASSLDEILYTLLDIRDSLDLLSEEEKEMSFNDFFDLKLSDLKSDFDEKFEFKDNIKEFIDGFFDSIKSAVPEYES